MAKRGKVKAKGNSDIKGALLDNFVMLQRTLVETAAALKQVDKKISSLLDLFEDASKSFKEKERAGGTSTYMASKLASIEEQNKVIAKTLLLLEKQMREKEKYGIARPRLAIEEEAESIRERIKPKAKKKKPEPEETEETEEGEPLFDESYGKGEETGEATEEDEEGEEFKPKPLPEFSF